MRLLAANRNRSPFAYAATSSVPAPPNPLPLPTINTIMAPVPKKPSPAYTVARSASTPPTVTLPLPPPSSTAKDPYLERIYVPVPDTPLSPWSSEILGYASHYYHFNAPHKVAPQQARPLPDSNDLPENKCLKVIGVALTINLIGFLILLVAKFVLPKS